MRSTKRPLTLGMLCVFIGVSSIDVPAGSCESGECDSVNLTELDCTHLSDFENPAHQGIAAGGGYYFTSKGNCGVGFDDELFWYTESNWGGSHTQVEVNKATSENVHLCHVGDPTVSPDNAFLYAPLSDFKQVRKSSDNYAIARWQILAGDQGIQFDTGYEMPELLRSDADLAGLAFDRSNPSSPLYAIEWRKDDTNPYVFRLEGWPPTLIETYQIRTKGANGIGLRGGSVFVTHGTDHDCGNVSLYDLGTLEGSSGDASKAYRTYKFDIANPSGSELFWHTEGHEVLDNGQLWVCAGQGEYVRRVQLPTIRPNCRTVISSAGCGQSDQHCVGEPILFDGGTSDDPNVVQGLTHLWRIVKINSLFPPDIDVLASSWAPTLTYAFPSTGDYYGLLTVCTDGETGRRECESCGEQVTVVDNELPVCNAGATYRGRYFSDSARNVSFDQEASSDNDGTIESWEWVFGDGSTSPIQEPAHPYSVDGIYDVTLTVTDDCCGEATCTTQAHVGDFPACIATGPPAARVADEVTFNGGKSFDFDPPTTPPSNSITSHTWHYCMPSESDCGLDSFNDCPVDPNWTPMDAGSQINHTFLEANHYVVRLTVTDDEMPPHKACCATPITIYPQGALGCDPGNLGNPYLGEMGQPITFDGSGSVLSGFPIDVAQYSWDFGDGVSGLGANSNHVYETSGIMPLELCVDYGLPLTSPSCCQTEAWIGDHPVAAFAGPGSAEVGRQIWFDASSSYDIAPGIGTIVAYEWDFDDDTVETTTLPTHGHTYSEQGTYRVGLCVTNDKLREDCTSAIVQVPRIRNSADLYFETPGRKQIVHVQED